MLNQFISSPMAGWGLRNPWETINILLLKNLSKSPVAKSRRQEPAFSSGNVPGGGAFSLVKKKKKRDKTAVLVIFSSFIYIKQIMTCVQSNSSDAKEISHASSARTTLADFHICTRWMMIDVDFHDMKHFYLIF